MRNDHPIENLRRAGKLSKKDLALKSGIPDHTISRIVRLHQIPDYDTALALANHFEMQWYRLVELCVQHRDREMRKKFSSKKSENTGYSHVCTTDEQLEKCGSR